tara:strand:- start:139 stop:342 length:204 start_codon:yes stop_codon:yes gene_type:complete
MPTNSYKQIKNNEEPKKRKMKLSEVFTHIMPNGDIHSGKTHTKNSKLIKKAKQVKPSKTTKKKKKTK